MHKVATLALLGALALNVRLAWWYRTHRQYVSFLESSLMAARLNQLHDLVKNLGRVQEKTPIVHVTEETPQEKRRHIRHLMDETSLTEPEEQPRVAREMLERLVGPLPDVCPTCKGTHPPYGSEGTKHTEETPPGSATS